MYMSEIDYKTEYIPDNNQLHYGASGRKKRGREGTEQLKEERGGRGNGEMNWWWRTRRDVDIEQGRDVVRGPRTEPWGTPEVRLKGLELWELIL